MRWLLVGLLISVLALVAVAVAVARHVRRQRKPLDAPESTAEDRKGEK